MIKKNKKQQCTLHAHLGKCTMCICFLFYFHVAFTQIYQIGGVEIFGDIHATVVANEKVEQPEPGYMYVAKNTILSDSNNNLTGKITSSSNRNKPIKKIAINQKVITKDKPKPIVKFKPKSLLVFNQNSDKVISIISQETSYALQNFPSQSKASLVTFFSKIEKLVSNHLCCEFVSDNLIKIRDYSDIYKIRPPPFLI